MSSTDNPTAAQLRTALHIIADQYDAAGGHMLTTEADLMFRECFCEFGETVPDALRRLLTGNIKDTRTRVNSTMTEINYIPPATKQMIKELNACSRSSDAASSARSAAIAEIQRICEEALDHGTSWPMFCTLVRDRMRRETVLMDLSPNDKSTNAEGNGK